MTASMGGCLLLLSAVLVDEWDQWRVLLVLLKYSKHIVSPFTGDR